MSLDFSKLQSLRYKHPKLKIKLTGYSCPQAIKMLELKLVPQLGIGMKDGPSSHIHVTKLTTKRT